MFKNNCSILGLTKARCKFTTLSPTVSGQAKERHEKMKNA